MSEFSQAIDYLHDSLLQLRSQGRENLVATKEALAQVLEAKPVKPVETASPQPPAEPATQEPRRIPSPPAHQASQAPQAPKASQAPQANGPKQERMAALQSKAGVCQKCPHLMASRTQVVFGVGNLDAEIMFVGEAPGEDEDLQGEPFVGKAGQLLTKIISAMGMTREDVYIANILKCRPDMPPGESGNRKPKPGEMATCIPYLIEQIQIIKPRVLIALGATAMQGLTGAIQPMNQLRGRWHEFEQIPLMATYHPAYLLRNQSLSEKRKVWEDMLQVLERLEKPISEKQRNFFR